MAQLLLNSHLCVALLEGEAKDPCDPNYTTPLHLAAKNGHREVIRYPKGSTRFLSLFPRDHWFLTNISLLLFLKKKKMAHTCVFCVCT